MDKEQIRSAVDLESFARERYNLTFDRQGRSRCPFTEDHANGDADPSLSLDRKRGRITCFSQGCFGEKGADLFGLVEIMDNVNFKTALKKLSDHAGIQSDTGRSSVTTPKHIRTLTERGIPEKTAQAFRLTEKPGDLMVTHKIIFPVTGPDGKVLGYKTHKGKHLLPNRTPAGKGAGIPLQLYPWSTLRKHQEVYLLNGEPSVWRAWEAGYRNVICGTGGEGTLKREWVEYFKGKVVHLMLDNDKKGRDGMQKIGKLLHGTAASIEVVVWPEGWKKKGDAEDWLNEGRGLEDLAFQPWEPEPEITKGIRKEKQHVDFSLELPKSVWRGVVKDYRDMLSTSTEASDAYHFFTFMACVGSVLGRRAFIQYGLRLYANLYVCLVGATGATRKSTSLRHSERIIREVDGILRVLRGLSSAEGLLSQVADRWEKRGKNGELIAEGGTDDKRLLVWLGELSSLLRKAKQDRVANIIPILTEAFDCPPDLHLPTKADPITVTEPYISLICASTPAWLEDLQDRDILGGFANRFVYILGAPKDPIPFPDPPEIYLRDKITAHLKDIQVWLPEHFEVTLDPSARDLWAEFYTRWHFTPRSDELFGAVVQRIPDVVLKIGLIYAVLEKRFEIDVEILGAAIDAGGYAVASAQRIFTEFHTSRESKLEGRILDILKTGAMNFGDLHRAVEGRHSTLELNRTVEALCRSKQTWRKEQGGTVLFGRTTEE